MPETLDWVKKIEESLWRLEERPQFGIISTFPWESLAEFLGKTLARPSLTLQSIGKGWMESSEALKGHLDNHYTVKCWLKPLSTPLFFSVGSRDLKWLFANLLGGDEEEAFVIEEENIRGFLQFLTLEIFSHIETMNWLPNLSFQLDLAPFSIEKELGENAFVVDVGATLDEKTLWGRLFFSAEFRAGFKRHLALLEKPQPTLEKADFPVALSCEIGGSTISYDEFKKTKIGDFILLDRSHFDIESKKGRLILTLAQVPLFRGKWEEGGIRLLEYPKYEEVIGMEKERGEEAEEGFFEEMEASDEESFFEEETSSEMTDSSERSPEEEKRVKINPEELPLVLTVELGRIQMKAADLLHLSPGDLLELNVFPEAGVDLVVQGKKVGKGELVKMEDLLFVRVLEL